MPYCAATAWWLMHEVQAFKEIISPCDRTLHCQEHTDGAVQVGPLSVREVSKDESQAVSALT